MAGTSLSCADDKYVQNSTFLPAAREPSDFLGGTLFLICLQERLHRYRVDANSIASPDCGQLLLFDPDVNRPTSYLQEFCDLDRRV
jgi:hypothetical protein